MVRPSTNKLPPTVAPLKLLAKGEYKQWNFLCAFPHEIAHAVGIAVDPDIRELKDPDDIDFSDSEGDDTPIPKSTLHYCFD